MNKLQEDHCTELVELDYCVSESTRLDVVLAGLKPDESRSTVQRWIRAGGVVLDGKTVSTPSYRIRGTGVIRLDADSIEQPAQGYRFESEPEKHTADALDVVYEDEHLAIINKPAGMVVHPGAGNHSRTLAHLVYARYAGEVSVAAGIDRPGIVHRLDKDTSGLIVVARSNRVHRALAAGFADRESDTTIVREYMTLIRGIPSPLVGSIEQPIARHPRDRKRYAVNQYGKYAITFYRPEKRWGGNGNSAISLLRCRLGTGRTHQIRVHLSAIGHPILGDSTYGSGKLTLPEQLRNIPAIRSLARQALHAVSISFVHPINGTQMNFQTSLPNDISNIVEALERINSCTT